MAEPYRNHGTSETDTAKVVLEIRGVKYEADDGSDYQAYVDAVAFMLDAHQPVRLK